MANRLTEQLALLNKAVEEISSYLSKNNLPPPSFEPDAPANLGLDSETNTAAYKAMDAAEEIYALLRGPRDLTMDYLYPPIQIYDMVLKFDIAKKVPVEGDISYSDLSAATGLQLSALTRVLRLGTLYHIFQEKRPGYISHTQLSYMLATNDLYQNYVSMIREDVFSASLHLAEALHKWPGSEEPSQTAVVLANNESGESTGYFSILAKDPLREQRFIKTMSSEASAKNLATEYDWASLGNGTLVDIGGSTGDTAFGISENFPSLNIVVQDLPGVVAVAKQREGHKVSFMAHDFLQEQPIKGADAYMLKWCLHDWSDKYCIRILRALIPALQPGKKVLIVDAVMPPFGSLPAALQKRVTGFDVGMLTLFNAKERTLDDWKELFAAAHAGFKLHQVVPLTMTHMSVVEVHWQPDGNPE